MHPAAGELWNACSLHIRTEEGGVFAARKTDVVFLAAVVFVPFYAPRTLHPPLSACSRKHCISIIPVPTAGYMACRGQNSGFLRRMGWIRSAQRIFCSFLVVIFNVQSA